MKALKFKDRVAVITGGGRGLGRSYAKLLASRGARVVVNDPGVSLQGGKDADSPADQVVREIVEAGGIAVANKDSVATPDGGQAIIQTAMDNFGHIDILIHNAGIVRRANLEDISWDDFETVLDVHLRGGFHVVRSAYPLMKEAAYGRVVLTGSINGLYGNRGAVNYSVAKGGLHALANVVALEGVEHGIKANVILPAALTRMAEGLDTSAYPPMEPELVAPAVGWLCHESCSISGEMLISAAGRVARAYVAETPGIFQPEWTIEDMAKQINQIRQADDPIVFPVLPSGHIDHLKYSFAMASASEK